MTTLSGTAPQETAPHPTFTRTIDRHLVHRAAVSEVFVTDLLPTGPGTFQAGAQLPLSHAYFSDHLHRPERYDFLLLLEAARQACTAAGHHQLDVPPDTVFMVNGWSIRLTDAVGLAPGSRPGELHLIGSATRREARRGRLLGVDYDVELRLAGRTVGRVTIGTSTVKAPDYPQLRRLQRGTVPPLTAELGHVVHSRPSAPSEVGCGRPENVVLGEPVHVDGGVRAQVEPRYDNSSLFDHTYDHVPAMVITEAARQLAHLAGVPTSAAVTGCSAEFSRFAELDGPLIAGTDRALTPAAALPGDPADAAAATSTADGRGTAEAADGTFTAAFEQDGRQIARVDLTFETADRSST